MYRLESPSPSEVSGGRQSALLQVGVGWLSWDHGRSRLMETVYHRSDQDPQTSSSVHTLTGMAATGAEGSGLTEEKEKEVRFV